MKLLVVDIDGTLIWSPLLSRFFWRLSRICQTIALQLQRVSEGYDRRLLSFDRVIFLTGRDLAASSLTRKQLIRLGLRFDDIISCPRATLIADWKLSIIRGLAKPNRDEIWWVDDQIEKTIFVAPTRTLYPHDAPDFSEISEST